MRVCPDSGQLMTYLEEGRKCRGHCILEAAQNKMPPAPLAGNENAGRVQTWTPLPWRSQFKQCPEAGNQKLKDLLLFKHLNNNMLLIRILPKHWELHWATDLPHCASLQRQVYRSLQLVCYPSKMPGCARQRCSDQPAIDTFGRGFLHFFPLCSQHSVLLCLFTIIARQVHRLRLSCK